MLRMGASATLSHVIDAFEALACGRPLPRSASDSAAASTANSEEGGGGLLELCRAQVYSAEMMHRDCGAKDWSEEAVLGAVCAWQDWLIHELLLASHAGVPPHADVAGVWTEMAAHLKRVAGGFGSEAQQEPPPSPQQQQPAAFCCCIMQRCHRLRLLV